LLLDASPERSKRAVRGKAQSAADHAALQIITRSKQALNAGASRGVRYSMARLARLGERKMLESDMHRRTAGASERLTSGRLRP
jgi:hypothetical protein